MTLWNEMLTSVHNASIEYRGIICLRRIAVLWKPAFGGLLMMDLFCLAGRDQGRICNLQRGLCECRRASACAIPFGHRRNKLPPKNTFEAYLAFSAVCGRRMSSHHRLQTRRLSAVPPCSTDWPPQWGYPLIHRKYAGLSRFSSRLDWRKGRTSCRRSTYWL